MRVSCSSAKTMSIDQRRQLARYRYGVFVQRLQWKLGDEHGLEQDQFDMEDTMHLVARDAYGDIVGCGRLLPTDGPYLLGDVFPELFNGMPPPRDANIWELSRFAVSASTMDPAAGNTQRLAERLLLQALRFCAQRGVAQLLAVTTPPVERLMRKAGVELTRTGPPVLHEGAPVLALVIAVNSRSIAALSRFEQDSLPELAMPLSIQSAPALACA